MPGFSYRAVAIASGEIRRGSVDAVSAEAVLTRLRRDGLVPIEVTARALPAPVAAGPTGRAAAACRAGLPDALAELSVLLAAGLPLDRALQINAQHVPQPALRAVFAAVRDRVKAGIPLARAMSESGGVFPPMACALVEAGEASGTLDASLARLAAALERARALNQTVRSAMVYPVLLLIVAAGVILVMLLVVVPQFETMLSDLGGTLPLATRVLIGTSAAVRDGGLAGLAGLIGLGVLARRLLDRPRARAGWDRLVLRLPLVGPLVANAETARLARTLGSLVESGVALPTALTISARAVGNSHMAGALDAVAVGVRQGGGLARPLAASGIFPPLAISFLVTGEETAQLGAMLVRLADVLDRDVATATQRLITVLTPMLTVVLGLAVAGIIASIFTAILGINDLAIQS